jgi:hypothetical protein
MVRRWFRFETDVPRYRFSNEGTTNMKRILASILGLGVISLGLVGCGDTASTKTETKMSTPGGTTTVTTEKEVKKTGDNPPATRP